MKRFHIHVAVDDLAANIRFYSTVFGATPTVNKPDYAKWMLDDPRINFAISARGRTAGVDHLGLQVDSDDELEALRAQLTRTDADLFTQQGATCCYAASNKHWITDPNGIAWESFHTLSSVPMFGVDEAPTAPEQEQEQKQACCAPPAHDTALTTTSTAAAGTKSACC